MVLLVQKYGGSSLTDLSKLEFIAKKIQSYVRSGYQVVVVLSAMSGETDRLIELSKYMNQKMHPRESDALLATGEQITTSMMSMALQRLGVHAKSLNAQQAGIYCDGRYSRAAITHINSASILSLVSAGIVPVITGFQGISHDGSVATLGRGGSDVTAVAVAAAIKANECQIFVDVHGVYSADPKIVQDAQLLHSIPACAMLEAASLGAKVIQKRAVVCAQKHKTTLRICSTYREGPGTMINTHSDHHLEQTKVLAITHLDHQILLQLEGFSESGLLLYLDHLSHSGLELMHTINVSATHRQLCLTMSENEYDTFKQLTDAWHESSSETISEKLVKHKAKVSLVGHLLSRDLHVTCELMRLCQKELIHVWHLHASDASISVLVDSQRVELLMRALHKIFISELCVSTTKEEVPMATGETAA